MKVLIAPDKWKGTLSARLACKAIEHGVKEVYPDAETILIPMADGGEGSLDLISDHISTIPKEVIVQDALGHSMIGKYRMSGSTAYIEVAQVVGLQLLSARERNPLFTTTYGVGEMILDAIMHDADHIVLLLGGSATNDMGLGMATALGYKFLDGEDTDIPPVGVATPFVMKIKKDLKFDPVGIKFTGLCDVQNPLLGEYGAVQTYAAQKGADAQGLDILEKGMVRMHKRCVSDLDILSFSHLNMTGAAGGLGAGVLAFLDGELRSGAQYLADQTGLTEHISDADIIITGEGRVDAQSFQGKVVGEIVARAGSKGKDVIAFCGIKEDVSHPDYLEVISVDDSTTDTFNKLKASVVAYFTART